MQYPQLTWGRDLHDDIRVRVGGNRVAGVIVDSHGGIVNHVVNDRVACGSAVETDRRAAIASEIQQGIAFDIVAVPADDDSSASQRDLMLTSPDSVPCTKTWKYMVMPLVGAITLSVKPPEGTTIVGLLVFALGTPFKVKGCVIVTCSA